MYVWTAGLDDARTTQLPLDLWMPRREADPGLVGRFPLRVWLR